MKINILVIQNLYKFLNARYFETTDLVLSKQCNNFPNLKKREKKVKMATFKEVFKKHTYACSVTMRY